MSVDRRLDPIRQIETLRSRYCRWIDTKQWDRLRGLFHPEARFEGFGSAPAGCDVDTFISGVAKRLKQAISVHQCFLPEIVFQNEGSARAVWGMHDYVEWPQGDMEIIEAPGCSGFVGYGYYEESYRDDGGRWLISSTRLTRLRIDPVRRDAATSVPLISLPKSDWLD